MCDRWTKYTQDIRKTYTPLTGGNVIEIHIKFNCTKYLQTQVNGFHFVNRNRALVNLLIIITSVLLL